MKHVAYDIVNKYVIYILLNEKKKKKKKEEEGFQWELIDPTLMAVNVIPCEPSRPWWYYHCGHKTFVDAPLLNSCQASCEVIREFLPVVIKSIKTTS